WIGGGESTGSRSVQSDRSLFDTLTLDASTGLPMKLILENVKFEHTIFALPFAYLGMVLAANGHPSLHQIVWITVAMASARTMAMSLNRAIDREIDARNARTAVRPIPSGRLSVQAVWLVALGSALVLAFSAWQLNDLAVKLLPVAMI